MSAEQQESASLKNPNEPMGMLLRDLTHIAGQDQYSQQFRSVAACMWEKASEDDEHIQPPLSATDLFAWYQFLQQREQHAPIRELFQDLSPTEITHALQREWTRRKLALILSEIDLGKGQQQLLHALWESGNTSKTPFATLDEALCAYAQNPQEALTLLSRATRHNIGALFTQLDPRFAETPYATESSKEKREGRPPKIRAHIRYMLPEDIKNVMVVENASFEFPWKESQLRKHKRERDVVSLVAEHQEQIIGFLMFQFRDDIRIITNFAVAPDWQGKTVGTQLLQNIIRRAKKTHEREAFSSKLCNVIAAQVRITNRDALRIFEKNGFELDAFSPDAYADHCAEPGINLAYNVVDAVHGPERSILTQTFGPIVKDIARSTPERENAKKENLTEKLFTLFAQKPAQQKNAVNTFRSHTLQTQTHIAQIITREGWRTIRDIAYPTHEEWAEYKGLNHVPKGLEEHCKILREVCRTEENREDLERWRSLYNYEAQDAKEIAIFHEVFAAVMKYPYHASIQEDGQLKGGYAVGTPRHAVEHLGFNCFTGPWIMAAMLLECGIPEERLFYCNLNRSDASYIAPHAGIMACSKNHNAYILDAGHRKITTPIARSFIPNASHEHALASMVQGDRRESCIVEIEKRIAEVCSLPYRMQVMPIAEGFSAGLAHHTGLENLHNNQLPEAAHAFELGLSLNDKDAWMLYQRGRLHFIYGDNALAKHYLRQALHYDDNVTVALFTLGEIALAEGDAKTARGYFRKFMADERALFNDDGNMRSRAEAYLARSVESEMLAMWMLEQRYSENPAEES